MKEKFSASLTATPASQPEPSDTEEKKQPYMIMPYAGARGEKIMKKIVRKMPENVRPKIVYNGTKLSSFFSVKDEVQKKHCSNIVYYYKSNREENVDYTGHTVLKKESRNTKEVIKAQRS